MKNGINPQKSDLTRKRLLNPIQKWAEYTLNPLTLSNYNEWRKDEVSWKSFSHRHPKSIQKVNSIPQAIITDPSWLSKNSTVSFIPNHPKDSWNCSSPKSLKFPPFPKASKEHGTAQDKFASLHSFPHNLKAISQWRNKWLVFSSLLLHITGHEGERHIDGYFFLNHFTSVNFSLS